MSRTIKEIYDESIRTRNKYMELSEYNNDSKMSVMNAITWVTSAAIFSFETLLDVFTVDIAKAFNGRINGTPEYYVNAMKKWQYGDILESNEEGTAFSYPEVIPAHRLITHVSYQEIYSSHYQDNMLLLKAATGNKNELSYLNEDQLASARKYLSQIKFAGVRCVLVSRQGDVLMPKLTVYYDGRIDKDQLYDNIEAALFDYIYDLKFDSEIYVQHIIDKIQDVRHVTDVYIDSAKGQGIFLAQYNDDGILEKEVMLDRKGHLSSGYIRQSSREGAEAELPTFKESIELKLEN